MELLIIGLSSASAAALTFFSGFGIGTLLLPVFALFFPIDLAVALTAIVHFTNNLLKLGLLGRFADRPIILRFGITAMAGGALGAATLGWMADMNVAFNYTMGGLTFQIVPVNVTIASLLVLFALLDIVPALKTLSIPPAFIPIGGIFSGFFGGLSGHQGALRSACLLKCGLTKEQFLGTGVVIACLVDVTRISLYSVNLSTFSVRENGLLLGTSLFASLLGTVIGNRFLKHVTIHAIQTLVAILLFAIALVLALGLPETLPMR